MKRVVVGFVRKERGFVEIEVSDDTSDFDVLMKAQEAEAKGMCNWGEEVTHPTGIIEEEIIKED